MAENWRNFTFNDDRYLILRTIETYERTDSGKSWRKNPSEVEREVVSAEYYTNYITAIPFFNNWGDGAYCRGVCTYTQAGYLPTTVTTVAPYRTEKKVATFRFMMKSDLEKEAVWREKEVMRTAKEFEIEDYGGYPMYGRRITLINPRENGVTHSATWDTGRRKWVN